MDRRSKIFVAGHKGLVGSALVRRLSACGYTELLLQTHAELDLTDAAQTASFFKSACPDYVFLAAAKVGGIAANNSYPVNFLRENLSIQANVIHSAWETGVSRLLFFGSSCIYPRDAHQPLSEETLMTGPLESTNQPYAIAKIAGIEMCDAYNRQFGTHFLAIMPSNLYGPSDNYDANTSHVLPALIRKFHLSKTNGESSIQLWGTGTPLREFLYSDDLADAAIHLMTMPDGDFEALLGRNDKARRFSPIINAGFGSDLSIGELAERIAITVGFDGKLTWDPSKPDGTPRKLLDSSRLVATGWTPRVPLDEGLVRAYNDYLKREGQFAGLHAH